MLAQEDISFIKSNLAIWLAEESLGKPPVVYEIELRERIVRVEEAIKNQTELSHTLIRLIDKRFDDSREESNRYFEQIDKRFQQVDKRFEHVDQQFEQMREESNKRFEQVERQFEQMREESNKRFEQVERQFEQVREESALHFQAMREDSNKRFDQVHQEILQIHRDMRQLSTWAIGIIVSIAGLGVAIMRLI